MVPHALYRRLGRTDEERRQAYRALFKAQLDPEIVKEIRAATNGNYALGSPRFQRKVVRMLGRRARRGQPGRPRKELDEVESGRLFDWKPWSVP